MNQLPASQWQELYPFQTKRIELANPNDADRPVNYHFVDEGQGDPLLFVHGNPTWSFYWHDLIGRRRDQNRCVAVDHVGCGRSDKPQTYPYTLTQHIDNLTVLIDRLDLRDITLLVHDWGGAIGLGAALKRLDRIKRLIIFNTGAFPPPYVPFRIQVCRWPVVGSVAVRGFNGFARPALTMAVEDRNSLSPAVRAGMIAPYGNWADRIATHKFVLDIPSSPKDPTWRRLEEIEKGLENFNGLPIKMIWGMKDWCFRPECLERFQRHWPNAEVCKLDNIGHYVVLEAAERVGQEVDQFLASNPA